MFRKAKVGGKRQTPSQPKGKPARSVRQRSQIGKEGVLRGLRISQACRLKAEGWTWRFLKDGPLRVGVEQEHCRLREGVYFCRGERGEATLDAQERGFRMERGQKAKSDNRGGRNSFDWSQSCLCVFQAGGQAHIKGDLQKKSNGRGHISM